MCKQRIVQTNHPDFLPCKAVIDAMYRCYTQDLYEEEYDQIQAPAAIYAFQFYECYFRKNSSLTDCMIHFENSIRALYRLPETKLTDYL